MSHKIDIKTKAIKRDTEGHFIMLKGRIHQEDIINISAPNIEKPNIKGKSWRTLRNI